MGPTNWVASVVLEWWCSSIVEQTRSSFPIPSFTMWEDIDCSFPWSPTTPPTPQGVRKVLLLAPPHLMKRPLSSEDHDWIAAHGGEEVTWTITLGYNDYTKHTILRAVLPVEVQEVPSGFEQVGHIAHFNLREEHLPYKNVIGKDLTLLRGQLFTMFPVA